MSSEDGKVVEGDGVRANVGELRAGEGGGIEERGWAVGNLRQGRRANPLEARAWRLGLLNWRGC